MSLVNRGTLSTAWCLTDLFHPEFGMGMGMGMGIGNHTEVIVVVTDMENGTDLMVATVVMVEMLSLTSRFRRVDISLNVKFYGATLF